MRRNPLTAAALAITFALSATHRADACVYHFLTGATEPTGIWPTDASGAASQLAAEEAADESAIKNSLTSALRGEESITPFVTPTIDQWVNKWLINTTGVKGKSTNTTINAAVSQINANVQQVRYTASNTYVKVSSVPDYNVGPFDKNPNVPANANATFAIPRNPTPAATHTATGLGAIGVLLNGVEIFNMSDSMSYQNQGKWHNNAGYVESPSFDAAKGHPQQQGVYHNHMTPTSLIAELGSTSTNPKLLGFAIDGYAVMDGYASLTPGGTPVKMTSSYQLKTYTNNVRGNGGPNVAGMYVNGYFEEDYSFIQNSGLLDEYNGRFVYTPEFPNGTYAYFATTDSFNNPAYPYLLGPSYYGTPSAEDLSGTVVVPSDSVIYVAPEPATLASFALVIVPLARRRK